MRKRHLLILVLLFLLPLALLYAASLYLTEKDIDLGKKVSKEKRKKQSVNIDLDQNVQPQAALSKLTDRQSNLLKLIKANRETKTSEIKNSFKSVTERTLRRDLNTLMELDLITKKGSTKSAMYFLKKDI